MKFQKRSHYFSYYRQCQYAQTGTVTTATVTVC